MEDRLIVTASPHIRDTSTTRGLMGNVVIALLPAVLAAGLIFGVQALVLVAVTTLACVAFEYIYEKLLKKSNTVGDLSAVVTGIILALNMPVGMPLWIAVVGAFVAIVITKQLFGGLGYNFANPALVGRIVLFLGFTSRMTAYVYPDMAVDALASATPLAVADKTTLPLLDVFLGFHGGMMGEVCVLAILLGFAYLVATRTIQATIPVTIVATVFVLTALNTGSASAARCSSHGPASSPLATWATCTEPVCAAPATGARLAFSPRLWRSWLLKLAKLRRTSGRIWANCTSPRPLSQASTAPQMDSSCSNTSACWFRKPSSQAATSMGAAPSERLRLN